MLQGQCARIAAAKHMAAATNSLRVLFPAAEGESASAAVSVASAYEELAPFGEIARLEVPPGFPPSAVVSYYDMRSAAKAVAVIGDRCVPEAQYGERTIWLAGDAQLHMWMIAEISAVRHEGTAAGGTYSLDFFDTRAAARAARELNIGPAQQKAQGEQQAVVQVENGAFGRRAVGGDGTSGPRYRNDLRLSEVHWADLSEGRDKRTTLRLRGLPAMLCEESAFQRVLAKAGLAKLVDCVRVFPSEGRRPGGALVNAINSASVIAVAKYFHGRQWGKSMPVAVLFAAVQGAAEVQRAFPLETIKAAASAAKGAKEEPWRVVACGVSAAGSEPGEPGVSEVSTEAGDDAESSYFDISGEAMRIPYPAVARVA